MPSITPPPPLQRIVITDFSSDKIQLGFPADQATMVRDGDSLIFQFDNGGSVELADFYSQFNQDRMPEFEVDGQLIAGADFFAAFGPDFSPAGGAGAAAGGNRYHEYGNANLIDGLTRLEESLDYRSGAESPAAAEGEVAPLPLAEPAASAPASNTPPVWSSVDGVSAAEGDLESTQNYTLSASLAATDADGDALTYSASGAGTAISDNAARSGFTADTFGNFSVNPATGAWTFQAATDAQKAAINSLADGETLTLTWPVQASDSRGGVIDETVTVTLTGTNDRPVLTNATASATEDVAHPGGSLASRVSDVDTGDTHTFAVVGTVSYTDAQNVAHEVSAAEAGFVLNIDGTWTIDTTADLYQDLSAGATGDLVVTYNATDNSGAADATSANATLTVTLTGTNDKPEVSNVTSEAVEDGAVVSGVFKATDADAADAHTFEAVSITYAGQTVSATDAGFTLNPATGEWSLNPSAALYQSLGEGSKGELVITYKATDNSGAANAASESKTLTVTLTGTNDVPEAKVATGAATEDTDIVSGAIPAPFDADAGDSHTFAVVGKVSYTDAQGAVHEIDAADAGFTLNSNGAWRLDPSAALYQSLDAGATGTLIVSYQATDDSGATDGSVVSAPATLTITLTGTNEQPVVDNVTSAAVEDGTVVSGDFKDTLVDADAADAHTFEAVSITYKGQTVTAEAAGFSLNSDGTWSLDPKAALYQNLREGATGELIVTYTATDDSGAATATSASKTLTVTLTGTNDRPEVSNVTSAAVEDAAVVSGVLQATDADTGDSHTFAVVGTIKYTDAQGAVHEIDAADAGFTLNSNGAWRLDPSAALYQSLDAGATGTLIVSYQATDDSGATDGSVVSAPATLTITLTGTNEQPVVDNVTSAAVEDGTVVSGDFKDTLVDADAADAHTFEAVSITYKGQTVTAEAAGFSLNSDGTWSLDPSAALYQNLREGATGELIVTYTATDDSGAGNAVSESKTLSVTLTGTNDQPVVKDLYHAFKEGDLLGYKLNVKDVDTGDTHTFAVVGKVSYTDAQGTKHEVDAADAGVTLYADGTWLSLDTANALYQDLRVGTTGEVVITYNATDDSGAANAVSESKTLTVTLTGTNDRPEVSNVTSAAVEDAAVVNGVLQATDVDTGDTHTFAVVGKVSYTDAQGAVHEIDAADAGFTLNAATGAWELNPSAALYQSLSEGATGELVITYTATDDSGAATATSASKTLSVTLTGTNDQPEVSNVTSAAVEDAAVVSGVLQATDADTGDSHTFAVVGTIKYTDAQGAVHEIDAADAGFTLNSNGAWSLDPSAALYQSLGEGATAGLVVSYTATDDKNATSGPAELTITITGTNDRPVVQNVTATPEAKEDGSAVDGTLTATDVDTGDTHTFAVVGKVSYTDAQGAAHEIDAADAGFTLTSDGTWSLDPTAALYQDLRAGVTGKLEVTYTATDNSNAATATSEPAKLTITINGADDPYAITAVDTSLQEPDHVSWWSGNPVTQTDPDGLSDKTALVNLSFTDPDKGDSISVTITSATGDSITFSTDNAGNITSFADGDSVLKGEWGQLAYQGGNWVYTAFNKADTLNPNDFDASNPSIDPATGNGLDKFSITASGSSGQAPAQDLTITVAAHDDAPEVLSVRSFTHDQPSQVLGPYLDEGNRSTVLSGTLNISDADSPDRELTFLFKNQDGEYVPGTLTGTADEPVWTFKTLYGTVTLTWDKDADDALESVTGNEAGAWQYKYVFDPSTPTEKNVALADHIDIRAANPDHGADADGAYDPADAATYVDLNIPVNIVTTDYGTGNPRPVYDVLTCDANGDRTFNNVDSTAYDNVLVNDRTINKTAAAVADGDGWEPATGITVIPGSGSFGNLGTWELTADGGFSFTLNENSAEYRALPAGQPVTYAQPYTIVENGKPFTSYIMVTIEGRNDAPEAENFSISLTPGWATASVNDIPLNLADHASDVDHDALSYAFYDASGNALEEAPGGEDHASWETPGAEQGFFYDPDKNGVDGFTQDVAGEHVYKTQYGWLVQGADGEFSYVADKTNPAVIGMTRGESLTETIQYRVSDGKGGESTLKTIEVTINGENDTLAVKTLDTTMDIKHGYQNRTVFDADGTPTDINGLSPEVKAMNTHGWAQTLFSLSGTNLAQTVDDVTGSFLLDVNGTNSVNLYGKNADGTFSQLGKLSVLTGGALYYSAPENVGLSALNGTYSEFYTNSTGTPLQVYVRDANNPTLTRTPVELEFTVSFADDSPTVSGVRAEVLAGQASGQVVFSDIDSAPDKLTLWVEGEDGKLVKIEGDGQEIEFGHGTLSVDKDGSFTYQSKGTADDVNHNIRVVVDDGTSASQNYIAIDNVAVNQLANLVNDKFNPGFSVDTKLGLVGNVLNNDSGYDTAAGVLNSGAYNLSGKVIRAADADDSQALSGGAAPELFTIAAGSRFDELKFGDAALMLNTDGSVYMATPATAPVSFHDSLTGATFNVNVSTAGVAFQGIAKYLNKGLDPGDPGYVSPQDIKNMLNFQLEYQVRDAETDELLTATAEFNVGKGYDNGGMWRSSSFHTDLGVSTAMDTTDDAAMLAAAKGVVWARDNDGGDVSLRVNSYDIAGNLTRGAYIDVRDFTEGHRGHSGSNTTYTGSETLTVPLYSWVNIETGAVGTAKGSGAGWICVQVGEGQLKLTTLGAYAKIGTDAEGNDLYAEGCGYVSGSMTRDFFNVNELNPDDPNYDALKSALETFYDHLRDMSEGQLQNLVFLNVGMTDGATVTDTANVISFTGSDVILGDNNQVVPRAYTEAEAIAGREVDFLAGAQHTFVNGADSTSRTDADGWLGIEFGDKDPTPGTVGFSDDVYGQYGMLTRTDGGKYTYQVYDPDDASLTDAQRAAGAAVRGLTDGQKLTETFDFTAYDKNLESDTGKMVITINGKTDGFTVHLPGGGGQPAQVTEGDVLDVSLAGMITTPDAGQVRYYIQYTDPDSRNVVNTWANPSDGAVELVETAYGRLVFSPTAGTYTFVPNDSLQENEVKVLDIKVLAELTDAQGVKHNSGWQQYDIKITGVNAAPEMLPENVFYAAPGVTGPGALAWTDVDNSTSEQAGQFTLDARSEATGDAGTTEGGLETVLGEYGELILDVNHGTFIYNLDENAFTGDKHRVVDEFQVKVTDPGSDGEGANAATSEEADLLVYGVDGDLVYGTVGADELIFNSGAGSDLSHIIQAGAGNDIINLANTSNQNILVWEEGDANSSSPAVDTIINFTLGKDGDALDLRGLLDDLAGDSGKSAVDLVTYTVDNGNTFINIAGADNQAPVQQIVLQNVELNCTNGSYEELNQQILLIT